MSFVQTLSIVVCLAIYLVSIFVFLTVCIGSPIRKFLTTQRLKQHSQRFPCGSCHYFSQEAALKCAVRPIEVMTEDAHNCRDFAARL